MRINRGLVVLFGIMAFALVGCFQQAGESFQPAGITVEPVTIPDSNSTSLPTLEIPPTATIETVDNGSGGNAQTSGSDESATPGIAITILSPTLPPLATSTPDTSSQTSSNGELLPTATPGQFVTPSSPLGPVTPDTPVPLQTTPSSTPSGLITPTALPGADSSDGCTHTVQPGDTLFRIATNAGITVGELRNANPNIGGGDVIQPGDVLNIPGCTNTSEGGSVAPTTAPNQPEVNVPAGGTTYTVARGDTLFAIAQKFGVTVQAIQNANNLDNPNQLSVGQELIIPPKSG